MSRGGSDVPPPLLLLLLQGLETTGVLSRSCCSPHLALQGGCERGRDEGAGDPLERRHAPSPEHPAGKRAWLRALAPRV